MKKMLASILLSLAANALAAPAPEGAEVYSGW